LAESPFVHEDFNINLKWCKYKTKIYSYLYKISLKSHKVAVILGIKYFMIHFFFCY
jgi:hypothetical protein